MPEIAQQPGIGGHNVVVLEVFSIAAGLTNPNFCSTITSVAKQCNAICY